MRRLYVLLCATALAACGEGSGPVATISIAPLLDSLFVGDTLPPGNFTVIYQGQGTGDTIPPGPVRWASSNTSVFTVDSTTGQVVGQGPGAAVLSAITSGVQGGALLVVSPTLLVELLLDTIYVLPGDTITIPVQVAAKGGAPPPSWFEPSPNPAIYTVDSATGKLTAVSPGGPVRFVVHADTVADTGAVEVKLLSGTSGGRGYFSILGTVIRRAGGEARGLNYKRAGDTLTFRLNIGLPTVTSAVENVIVTLKDSVLGPGTFPIDSLGFEEAFASGQDQVCRPVRNWGLWSTRLTAPTLTALSRAGGSISITTVDTISGDTLAISGRFLFNTQRTDFYSNAFGMLPVRGTFVASLVKDLRPCIS